MRMRMRLCAVALILVVLLGGSPSVGAQGLVSLILDDLVLDDFPQTRALVTVRNEDGVPIVGLGPGEFEIVEDGKTSFPPSAVTTQINPEAVISVVVVIDISGSMEGKPINEAMRAANALIDQLSPQDRAAIIAFADHVDLDPQHLEEGKEVAFTTDKNGLRNVVNFLDEQIGWDTPLYDAIYKGVKMASNEPVGKRAVIVMTDGRDERDNAQGVPVQDAGSLSSPDDPINEANQHNIPIFSIGLVGLGGKIDTKYLRRLAERTGGVYQRAPEPEELAPLFENVVDQLKQQYVLTYDSTLPDDSNYHSLLIRVQLPQGQAFDEDKFRIWLPEPAEELPSPTQTIDSSQATPVATSGSHPSPLLTQLPTAQPTSAESAGQLGRVQGIIEEQPLLAAVIGLGVLLLLILIIALVIVMLRGRRTPEGEWRTDELVPTLGSTSDDWPHEQTEPNVPVPGGPPGDGTAVSTPGWRPGTPVASPTPPGPPPGPVLQAGQTRIITRAPKHLAMLVDKAQPEQKYDLGGRTNIGRGQNNQVVLNDPTVSRNHAWIKAEGDSFLIFDVGSANGTFVNDRRVEDPQHLTNGDVVRFGEAEFVFTKVF